MPRTSPTPLAAGTPASLAPAASAVVFSGQPPSTNRGTNEDTNGGTNDGEVPGLPLYLQVAATLRTAILREVHPAGSRIPTEEDLCQHFKVSRHTIREALRRLRDEGLITSRRGERPVVAPPPAERAAFTGVIGEDFFDYTIGTRLDIESLEPVEVARSSVPADGFPAAGKWLRACGYRRHVDTGRVTCWNEYLIHPRFAPIEGMLARHVGPLIPLIEELSGERIVTIVRSIRAVPLPDRHAKAFGMDAATPALSVTVRSEVGDGTLALVHRSTHPDAVISYTIRR